MQIKGQMALPPSSSPRWTVAHPFPVRTHFPTSRATSNGSPHPCKRAPRLKTLQHKNSLWQRSSSLVARRSWLGYSAPLSQDLRSVLQQSKERTYRVHACPCFLETLFDPSCHQHCRNHQRPKGLPLNRVSSQTAARPAVRMVISNSVISSVNRELLKPSRHPCGPDYSCPIIFSTIHITISGYWVGPDIEDGWGYVEASVNQVSVC